MNIAEIGLLRWTCGGKTRMDKVGNASDNICWRQSFLVLTWTAWYLRSMIDSYLNFYIKLSSNNKTKTHTLN